MKNIPRILPLIGVAAGGVLAINAMSGAKSLPDLVSGAKAFAEGVAKPEGKEAAEGEGAPSAEGAAQPAAARRLPLEGPPSPRATMATPATTARTASHSCTPASCPRAMANRTDRTG